MRIKILEPILLLGRDRFANVDIRIRVSGGGFSSQVYAIRQAIAKAMVAYAQKCEYRIGYNFYSTFYCVWLRRRRKRPFVVLFFFYSAAAAAGLVMSKFEIKFVLEEIHHFEHLRV